ncbi:MAG: cob(I)yrinic acid a,c-diamide adenosyltransferase [Bacteroidia bacterium]|nr:cob(I)yrinic acid a,c-diamide adenosyltransferase [Bacteroidia bacterium]
MKIYTKKGDTGDTGLLGGTRVPKYHLRIEAYGTIDELNACLGMLADHEVALDHITLIRDIQGNLFVIGSHLANDEAASHFTLPPLPPHATELLEHSIDQMEAELPPLKNFVLPGGHPANSAAHLARCVCRRAERRIVELSQEIAVVPEMIVYLNRLSDWLFVLSRLLSHRAGAREILWNG